MKWKFVISLLLVTQGGCFGASSDQEAVVPMQPNLMMRHQIGNGFWSALLNAVERGTPEQIENYFSTFPEGVRRATLDVHDIYEPAVKRGDLSIIEELIKGGAPVTSLPLQHACRAIINNTQPDTLLHKLTIAARFLAAGADPRLGSNQQSQPPLWMAFNATDLSLFELFLIPTFPRHLKIDEKFGYNQETLFHAAARTGNASLAQFFRKKGANVLISERNGRTALQAARSSGIYPEIKEEVRAYWEDKFIADPSKVADQCVICVADMKSPAHGVILENCGHQFHRGCIEKVKKTKTTKCPLCRTSFCHHLVMRGPYVGAAFALKAAQNNAGQPAAKRAHRQSDTP